MKGLDAKSFFALIKETYTQWSEHKASRLAAAFAYYTVFSMAPMLIVFTAIAGLVFKGNVQDYIIMQMRAQIGPQATDLVATMLSKSGSKDASIVATIIGILTSLLGAAGLFGQLQDALNTIWEVAPKPNQGIMAMIRQRFLSFAMVLGTGLLLAISMLLSIAIEALTKSMSGALPLPPGSLRALNEIITFGVMVLMFAMIFRVLPDVKIGWKDVWVGAIITSFLFTVGKFALGLYLAHVATSSPYGAASSLVLILLWVYYAAQILFFGAQFTQVYGTKYGTRIEPSPHAVAITEDGRARQGMPSLEGLMAATHATEVQLKGKPGEQVPVAVPSGVSPHTQGRVASKQQPGKVDTEYLASVIFGTVAGLFIASRRMKNKE
ncbi:MAG: YihY/virulence factor BrkB family protein [Abitibacteriaceae bacterium]|nr:YihY/virulence factor BrkB family protein [Abditibacteriaceae bacterium]